MTCSSIKEGQALGLKPTAVREVLEISSGR